MIRLGTRRGKPAIGLGELVKRTQSLAKKSHDPIWCSFLEHVKSAVSEEEALDAARALSESRQSRIKRYAQGAGIGAVAAPVISVAGEVAKNVASGHGVRGVGKAVREGLSRSELAKTVTRGTLGGGALQAVRENVQLVDAKKKVKDFLREHGQ